VTGVQTCALPISLLDLEAILAYDIDFPEEDDGNLPQTTVSTACAETLAQLDLLLATAPAAIIGREGATVVLAGLPNAGKSSLLNALVGEVRMIVSETPGTTRDAVEVVLDRDPWPLRLVDTAGLRESGDPVELLGIQLSQRYLAHAHVVVACADSAERLALTAATIARQSQAPIVGALTKRDLVPDERDTLAADFPVIPVSAVRGDGLESLLACVTAAASGIVDSVEPDVPVLTRARHQASLARARAELAVFSHAWKEKSLPVLVAATHVRAATVALDELIGTVDVEDIFARVFSTFCVGK
jgi:tRNA modification GTPase